MQNLFGVYLSFFLLFMIGFGVQKIRHYSNEGIQTFTSIILDIFFPIYIIYVLTTNPIVKDLRNLIFPVLAGLGVALLAYFLAPILSKPVIKTESDKTANGIMQMIGNYAFLGLPLAESIFGSEGLAYAVMIKIGLELVIFSLGVARLRTDDGKFQLNDILSPVFIATIVGLILGQFEFSYPLWMDGILSKTGAAVSPLGFIVSGIMTANVSLHKFEFGKIAYISLIKMIVIPLLVFGFGYVIGIDHTLLGIITIYVAMPFGVTPGMFLERYGHDPNLASMGMVFATLVSPFVLIGLNWFITTVL
jgi:predicted permease